MEAWTFMLAWILMPLVASPVTRNAQDAYDASLLQARAEYHAGHFKAAEGFYLAVLGATGRTNDLAHAETLAELGDVYLNEDELWKAERAYQESLVIYRRLEDKERTLWILRNLGATYSLEGRNDDALRILRQALTSATTDSHVNRVVAGEVLNCLGMVYYRLGKNSKAEAVLNQALQVASGAEAVIDRAAILNNLGAVYQAKHKFERAENYFKEALKSTELKRGPVHPDLTFSLSLLGILYTSTGRYAEAEEQFQRALRILQPDKLDFDTRVARILQDLGVTYRGAGRSAEADAALAQAVIIARRNLSKHPDMAQLSKIMPRLCRSTADRRRPKTFAPKPGAPAWLRGLE